MRGRFGLGVLSSHVRYLSLVFNLSMTKDLESEFFVSFHELEDYHVFSMKRMIYYIRKVPHTLVHMDKISRRALQDDHLVEDLHSPGLVPRLLVSLGHSGLPQVWSLSRQKIWSEDC